MAGQGTLTVINEISLVIEYSTSHSMHPLFSYGVFVHDRELVENGTTTPSSVSFHYDNPRPLFYDVPRSSIRSRHGSGGSLSTIGSNVEVKNPAYQTKKR